MEDTDGACITALHVDAMLEDCAWMPDGEGVLAVGAAGVYFMRLSAASPARSLAV
jgi:hypothetical protein